VIRVYGERSRTVQIKILPSCKANKVVVDSETNINVFDFNFPFRTYSFVMR